MKRMIEREAEIVSFIFLSGTFTINLFANVIGAPYLARNQLYDLSEALVRRLIRLL